uniref:Putative secreted protein n=1 Tax=Anopheles marajoara TaxID=58244 RepID=A0A2M4C651_9DIPT
MHFPSFLCLSLALSLVDRFLGANTKISVPGGLGLRWSRSVGGEGGVPKNLSTLPPDTHKKTINFSLYNASLHLALRCSQPTQLLSTRFPGVVFGIVLVVGELRDLCVCEGVSIVLDTRLRRNHSLSLFRSHSLSPSLFRSHSLSLVLDSDESLRGKKESPP